MNEFILNVSKGECLYSLRACESRPESKLEARYAV